MSAVNTLTDFYFFTKQNKNTILIVGPLRISIFVHREKSITFFGRIKTQNIITFCTTGWLYRENMPKILGRDAEFIKKSIHFSLLLAWLP